MSEDKRPAGRPRLYETPEAFDDMVELYKAEIRANETPATWTGLALFLGFSSRQSIDEYQKYDGFSDSVKRAKLFIESEYEKRLFSAAPTGAIFGLKNYGWSDKQEIALGATEAMLAAMRETTRRVMLGDK